MNTPHPYDLVIGLDRSDKKADLRLITTATGQRRSQIIDTAPEALWEWLLQLRQEQAGVRTRAVTVAGSAFSPGTNAKAKGKGRIRKKRETSQPFRAGSTTD